MGRTRIWPVVLQRSLWLLHLRSVVLRLEMRVVVGADDQALLAVRWKELYRRRIEWQSQRWIEYRESGLQWWRWFVSVNRRRPSDSATDRQQWRRRLWWRER